MSRKFNRHVIDFIFPLALLFGFVASCVVILLISSDFYQRTNTKIQSRDTSRTSLSYIQTKIRHNDSSGAVSVQEIDGISCLTIEHKDTTPQTVTYIYYHEDYMKELFLVDGTDFSLDDGTNIIQMENFEIKKLSSSLFQFTATDKRGVKSSLIVSERSER
ncbi:hypothetical protein M2454_001030 [Aequitasia blattaphilus]|uniref:DUF4860 domain-containing protein n=1 Tax=Aequitasia blattaphilus TaxID=2949332 RepID=A0ABT1EBQ0_9FIRM|nr:DUF4860 domain-containing protein [Aequitasia blattaphilus]MCP1102362.1 DUF4860 domain-containing protein [Aequitasia blattaphilus]MCR8615002.1 DUF4860 domain-containing protein [Aequitasia blattaphilus]